MKKFYFVMAALTLITSLSQAQIIPSSGLNNTASFSNVSDRCIKYKSRFGLSDSGCFNLQPIASSVENPLLRDNRLKSSENTYTVTFNILETENYEPLGLAYVTPGSEYWGIINSLNNVSLIPGQYSFVLLLQANGPGFPTKILIKENIDVSEDLTLTLNPDECVDLVKFNPILPDGSVVEGPTFNSNYSLIKDGNIGTSSYIFSAFGSKKLGCLFYAQSDFSNLDSGGEVISFASSGDFLVNPGISSDYQFSQMSIVMSKEDATPLIICNQTETPEAQIVSNNTDFAFTSYNQQFTTDYFALDGPSFVATRNVFITYFLDRGIPSHGMTISGTEISEASRIGMNNASLSNEGFMDIILSITPELQGDEIDGGGFTYYIMYSINPAYTVPVNNSFRTIVSYPYIYSFYNKPEGEIDTDLTRYGNPNFSFYENESRQTAGDNVPYIFLMDYSLKGNGQDLGSLRFGWYYLGRVGERPSEVGESIVKIKYDDVSYENSFSTLEEQLQFMDIMEDINEKLESYNGYVHFELDNSGIIEVDGIPGVAKIEAQWNCAKHYVDATVPTLTMLQFRDKDGIVTDHFEDSSEGVIMFSAADFVRHYESVYDDEGTLLGFSEWYDYNSCPDVIVEYAPYGSEDWTPIEVTEDPEKFYMPGYGAFFSGSLSGVDKKSPNGWMNLRISLADDYDNKLVTEVGPAFKISSLADINEINDESRVLIYKVEGRNLIVPAGTEVYNSEGIIVKPVNLIPGIYFLRNGALATKCRIN